MSTIVDLAFFDAIQASMEAEATLKDNIRASVRELDRTNRNITAVLNRVHSSPKEQVKVDLDNNMTDFQISIEEFLHGVVSLTNELSRLAVNAVTAGDFNRPVRIGKFLKELYSGFQLLNLKNDTLRKRFDSIKYDIKKVEEIIYDLTVRKLVGTQSESVSIAESIETDV
ncbi:hypothetical protein BGW38_002822 [Lunasporangiospora selenospora]|uniref:Translin n=1 Tax=Lunasporangiospora selenospora TaxID=979761 RepID=A0A9P6KI18_9FUNG|nr:hypothetical protein BGW38_002822 [Lunasporangiospora selenospora]